MTSVDHRRYSQRPSLRMVFQVALVMCQSTLWMVIVMCTVVQFVGDGAMLILKLVR